MSAGSRRQGAFSPELLVGGRPGPGMSGVLSSCMRTSTWLLSTLIGASCFSRDRLSCRQGVDGKDTGGTSSVVDSPLDVATSNPQSNEGAHISVAADVACIDFLSKHGIFMSREGIPRQTQQQLSPNIGTDEGARELAAGLEVSCSQIGAAQVLRSLVLATLGDYEGAHNAAREALLMEDLPVPTRLVALELQSSMRPLASRELPTAAEESSMRQLSGMGIMWVPGVTDQAGLGLSEVERRNAPRLEFDNNVWLGLGFGLGGLGAFFAVCGVANCFQLHLDDRAIVRLEPKQPEWQPKGPVIGVIPPENQPPVFVKVHRFPALGLPPVGEETVDLVPLGEYETCWEFMQAVIARAVADEGGAWGTADRPRFGYTNWTAPAYDVATFQRGGLNCAAFSGWGTWVPKVESRIQTFLLSQQANRSVACRSMVGEFNDAAARHEAQHQRDFNEALVAPPVITVNEVCANDTPDAVKELLHKKVEVAIAEWTQGVENKLHQTPAGGDFVPDCRTCDGTPGRDRTFPRLGVIPNIR